MQKNETYVKFPITGIQILGILFMLTGFVLLFSCGLRAIHYISSDPHSQLAQYQMEIDAGVDMDAIVAEIRLENRKKAAAMIPWLILGGILVISCPPMFYAPYADGLRIRIRKTKDDEEPDNVIDEGYDYPDDEFDFILDRNVRDRLIREKEERLKKRHN